MSDLLSSFTVYRDVLLLFINGGMLVLLFIIAGQMNGQRQRSKVIPKHITELLEKILMAQRKAATSLTSTNNEFRNHLKEMALSVESSVQPSGSLQVNRLLRGSRRLDVGESGWIRESPKHWIVCRASRKKAMRPWIDWSPL